MFYKKNKKQLKFLQIKFTMIDDDSDKNRSKLNNK